MKRLSNWLVNEMLLKCVKYIPLLILLLDSCIEPFNLHIATQQDIVVDGLISDQPGPQVVKIYKTFDLNLPYNQIHWVSGASVSIFDEQNNETKLSEYSDGVYHTDSSFQGVPGKTYQLRFSIGDGNSYESIPEKMLPVGDIDSVYYQFELNESSTTLEHGYSANGFRVKLDGEVLSEQSGHVRWRWTGTFGLKTYPELQTRPSDTKVSVPTPDPPSCSGYNKKLQYTGSCTCCHCYVTQTGDVVNISDKNFIDNGKVKGQNIVFIQANRRFMYEKYYLEIEQMSVTPSVYDFWQKVEAQGSVGSNLFQTPPSPTGGNVHQVSGSTPVSGIFTVSSIKRKHIIFTKDDVPYNLLPIDTIAGSCRVAYPNSTTRKPTFW